VLFTAVPKTGAALFTPMWLSYLDGDSVFAATCDSLTELLTKLLNDGELFAPGYRSSQ
jgi:hypothetical protein